MREDVNTSGMTFGLINTLRTGSVIVDMFIAMLIPLIFRSFSDGRVSQWLKNLSAHFKFKRRDRESIRSITFQTTARHGMQVFDSRNELLQKALTLFFTDHLKTKYPTKANVALTTLHDRQYCCFERPDKHNPLEGHRLTWLAPDNEWVPVEDGIEFRQFSQNLEGGDAGADTKKVGTSLTFELKSSGKGAAKRIDDLISRAVDWYKAELRSQKDDSRYLYTMLVEEKFSYTNTDKGKDDDAAQYKRYKLSDHKTFSSLFFPQKDELLTLLDDFTNKNGKYAIAGFPHKLGLLLHGPPGTGKTSLIKALAHKTGRSIISVPLAQVRTNQTLMDVMFDLQIKVKGINDSPHLTFKDVIFVLEDIDAATNVVLRRDGSFADGTKGGAGGLGGLALDDPSAKQLKALASSLAAGQSRGMSVDDQPGGDGKEPMMGPKMAPTMADLVGDMLLKPRPDELSLAGVLNVLDGIVDTPGRLVIMTSNHPEKLDRALIRPGRIDHQVFLGYLQPAAAASMLEHYFDGTPLDARQRARLDALLGERTGGASAQVTPAMLEMLCARHKTVDALLVDLEASVPSAEASVVSGVGAAEDKVKESAFYQDTLQSKEESESESWSSMEDVSKEKEAVLEGEKAERVPSVAAVKRQVSGG